MATINGITKRAAAPAAASKAPSALGVMIGSQSVQQRFEKMLGKKSAGFLSSLLTLTNNNKLLATANPKTILAAAATAARVTLDSKALKKDLPDVYEKYAKVGKPSMRFTLK